MKLWFRAKTITQIRENAGGCQNDSHHRGDKIHFFQLILRWPNLWYFYFYPFPYTTNNLILFLEGECMAYSVIGEGGSAFKYDKQCVFPFTYKVKKISHFENICHIAL